MSKAEVEQQPAVDGLATTSDLERIEAPVTWKAYLLCAFAALGGIFYGYDTGYISNINAMDVRTSQSHMHPRRQTRIVGQDNGRY